MIVRTVNVIEDYDSSAGGYSEVAKKYCVGA